MLTLLANASHSLKSNNIAHIHEGLLGAIHIKSLVLARVIAHILNQHLTGSQENKWFTFFQSTPKGGLAAW